MSAVLPLPRLHAWRPPVPGIREVLHADVVEHAYPPHVHDTWTLFVVDDGAIRYDLDRHEYGARRSMVSVLPPHVVHDGRPANSRGYRKRVVYLEADVLGEDVIGHAVDRPYVEDRRLRRGVAWLHELLRARDDALAAESMLALIAEHLRGHLRGRPPSRGFAAGGDELAERLRAMLDARAFEALTLAAAGAELGATPAHLVRSFTRRFGISPHAYLIGRRIEAARARLLDGEPIAEVAAAVGFYDQSHLARHFKRHMGTTPGRFGRRS